MTKINVNGIIRDMTAEEQAEHDARKTAAANGSKDRKLEKIKELRLRKLEETDWWVLRGDITDAQKTWRQSLRDIPTNYTTEDEYDILLEVEGTFPNITRKHSIWSKP